MAAVKRGVSEKHAPARSVTVWANEDLNVYVDG